MDDSELSGEAPGSVEWAVRCWVRSVLKQEGMHPPPPGHPRIDKELLKFETAWLARTVINLSYLRLCRVRGVVVGFAVLDTDTVHFVYVDHDYRRKGLAAELVQDVVARPWFYTADFLQGGLFVQGLTRKGLTPGKFNPFRLCRLLSGDFDLPSVQKTEDVFANRQTLAPKSVEVSNGTREQTTAAP